MLRRTRPFSTSRKIKLWLSKGQWFLWFLAQCRRLPMRLFLQTPKSGIRGGGNLGRMNSVQFKNITVIMIQGIHQVRDGTSIKTLGIIKEMLRQFSNSIINNSITNIHLNVNQGITTITNLIGVVCGHGSVSRGIWVETNRGYATVGLF
jgi:hypothetical protein